LVLGDIPIAILGLLDELLLQSLNNLLPIQLFIGRVTTPFYLGRDEVNCWDVLIIIGKREITFFQSNYFIGRVGGVNC